MTFYQNDKTGDLCYSRLSYHSTPHELISPAESAVYMCVCVFPTRRGASNWFLTNQSDTAALLGLTAMSG